jgi:hypothetical protein
MLVGSYPFRKERGRDVARRVEGAWRESVIALVHAGLLAIFAVLDDYWQNTAT